MPRRYALPMRDADAFASALMIVADAIERAISPLMLAMLRAPLLMPPPHAAISADYAGARCYALMLPLSLRAMPYARCRC